MSQSAVEKIKEIQERAEEEIKELRQQAVSELVNRLAEAKAEVRALEEQYAALTGEPAPGGEPAAQPDGKKSRKRLSADDKAVLVESLRAFLAGSPTGISMGELVKQSGESVGTVRKALAEIKTKTTGSKSTTKYFLQ